MSVYRYKGKWKAEIWKTGQRLESKAGFETKELAKEWYHQTLISLQSKSAQVKKNQEVTFDDLLDYYQRIHMPTIGPETQRRYRTDIDYRIREFFQHRSLDSITPLMIEAFRSKIMKDLKPKSVNNCTLLLRSIFKKGEEWGMLEKSPFKLKALRLADQKFDWWENKEHIQAFLEAAKGNRYHAAYRLALECGLRLGEIVGLS
ncbi:MAG: hypothetical protein EBQ92_12570, partial [Proteobacteria bacterium]|nr:hypothetical protein [Pseudomonadota bacterium]